MCFFYVFIHHDDGKYACFDIKNLPETPYVGMRPKPCVAACETHQQTLVSEEGGVGEGRTRAVVTGDKDGVQTAGSSRHLGQFNKNTKLTFWQTLDWNIIKSCCQKQLTAFFFLCCLVFHNSATVLVELNKLF